LLNFINKIKPALYEQVYIARNWRQLTSAMKLPHIISSLTDTTVVNDGPCKYRKDS